MVNVRNGTTVKGDGNHDDTDGLQDYINDADGALYFPPGKYRITKTLVFPNKTGHHWIGSGMSPLLSESSPARGAESAIVWCGYELPRAQRAASGFEAVFREGGL